MKKEKKWVKLAIRCCMLALLVSVLSLPQTVLAGGSTSLSVRSGQDITAQLKKAIKKYDTIRIPAGTYKIKGTLTLDNRTVIQPKSGNVVLQQQRSGKSIFAVSRSTKKLTLKGLTLDGQGRSGALLSVKNGANLTLSNIKFVNSRSYGLYLNKTRATITGCTWQNNKGTGLYATGNAKMTLKDASITGGSTGIYLNSKYQAALTRVQVADVESIGLNIRSGARLTSAVGCSFLRAGSKGVYVQKGCTAVLQNCTISGNHTDGLHVNNAKAQLTSCLITGNGHEQKTSNYNSIGYGIHMQNNANVTIKGGKVNSNLGYGVICSSGTLDVQGSANAYSEFMYNAWSGLSFSGSRTKINMQYARCSENGYDPKGNSEGQNGHGLGVTDGAKGYVRNSLFEKNGVCGISLFGNNAVLDIANCTASNNGRHGIGGRKGVTLTASNMTLNNNVQHGIMLLDNSTGTMNAITACNNGKFGLDIGMTTKSVTVSGCRTDGNSDGVYIYTARNVQVKNTSGASNKRYGLYVSKDASASLSGNSFKNNYRKDTSIN